MGSGRWLVTSGWWLGDEGSSDWDVLNCVRAHLLHGICERIACGVLTHQRNGPRPHPCPWPRPRFGGPRPHPCAMRVDSPLLVLVTLCARLHVLAPRGSLLTVAVVGVRWVGEQWYRGRRIFGDKPYIVR